MPLEDPTTSATPGFESLMAKVVYGAILPTITWYVLDAVLYKLVG